MGEDGKLNLFSGILAPESAADHYVLRYAEFVVPLVKAVFLSILNLNLPARRSRMAKVGTCRSAAKAQTFSARRSP